MDFAVVTTKYCEWCGRQFLRPEGSKDNFCADHQQFNSDASMSVDRVRARIVDRLHAELRRDFASEYAMALSDAIMLLDVAK